MSGTFDIPLTSLNPGTYFIPVTGGYAVADSDSMAQVMIDRTVTGGLDSVPASMSLSATVSQSNDNGASWFLLGGSGTSGGVIYDRHTGQNDPYSGFSVSLDPGSNRLIRASVIVAGSTVSVQGTLTIS